MNRAIVLASLLSVGCSSASTSPTTGDGGTPSGTYPNDTRLCNRMSKECSCMAYDQCLQEAASPKVRESYETNPSLLECIIASSCESLCVGKPDACSATPGPGPGPTTCSSMKCTTNGDCPVWCGSVCVEKSSGKSCGHQL